MKPDEPGLWVSEHGHVAIVWLVANGRLAARAVNGDFLDYVRANCAAMAAYPYELPDCRWKKVEVPVPEFPPEKPELILAKRAAGTPLSWFVRCSRTDLLFCLADNFWYREETLNIVGRE